VSNKLKVVSYEATLNPKARIDTTGKNEILIKFIEGVNAFGDEGIVQSNTNIISADAAVMVGWVHENSKSTPHLIFRKRLYDHQQSLKKKTIFADSNLFLYANKSNPHRYLRYSYDGIFPNTGNYCDDNLDPSRWKSLSKNIGISLKDYRTTGSHILLCLQRNGGWSMDGFDVMDWASETIKTLRKYTNRPIIIRPHPGDKNAGRYLNPVNLMKKIVNLKDVRVSRELDFFRDLKNCWAVVNYNSSPTIGAAIEGYPVFVTDPSRSQARDIANTDLSKIENPTLPDRQQWVERLAMFHWNFKEIESGEAWAHMRKYV
jgi:hypothetical protein